MHRVVITGLGFVTSIGNTKSDVLSSLKNLTHGIEPYAPFIDDPKIPISVAATLKGFNTTSSDPEDWEFPASLKLRLDTLRGLAPHGLYAFYALEQALQDAGLSKDDIAEDPNTGLYSASAGSVASIYTLLNELNEKGVMRCPPTGMIRSIVGTLNYTLTAAFKIQGASCGFASACASSSHALGFAFNEIKLGNQNRMIVVGAEDFSNESIVPFAGMRVLSTATDPNKASRPFDRDRDGFVGTGGATVMILEEESLARKRGAEIYAEFLGWGQATDGYHPAKPHPEGLGLQRAMTNAFQSAKVHPEQINYINSHATGTHIGDIAEINALRQIYKNGSVTPALSSTKALTGHLLSGAGAMEAAFTTLSIKENITPGSANIENLDEATHGVNVIRETLPHGPQFAMSNSSGFGGANVSLIFSKYHE